MYFLCIATMLPQTITLGGIAFLLLSSVAAHAIEHNNGLEKRAGCDADDVNRAVTNHLSLAIVFCRLYIGIPAASTIFTTVTPATV